MIFNQVAGGGGGLSGGAISKLRYILSGSPTIVRGVELDNIKSVTDYLVPTNDNSGSSYLYPKWSDGDFEIGSVIFLKVGNTNIHDQAIWGGLNSYYDAPSLEIQPGGSLWCGVSSSGSSWDYQAALPRGTIVANKWYYVYQKMKNGVVEIGATTDFQNYVTNAVEMSAVPYTNPSRTIEIGGTRMSDNQYCDRTKINLLGTYIKINGELIWGSTYLEDNKTFTLSDTQLFIGVRNNTSRPYINTGVIPTINTRVQATIAQANKQAYFFSGWSVAYNDGAFGFVNDNTEMYIGYNGQGGGLIPDIIPRDSIYHTVELNRNAASIDGVIKYTFNPVSDLGNTTQPLFLFTANRAGTPGWYSPSYTEYEEFTLIGCKIWDNDVLIRDYIPALDGNFVACLYDNVNQNYVYPVQGYFTLAT